MKARPKMLREGIWIPAKAGIHDFHASTERRDKNAAYGNNP
jgi:hypothetical protein